MRTSGIAALAVLLLFMLVPKCLAVNPNIGTWTLNKAKSKMLVGMTGNNTVTYSEQGDKIKATTDGTARDGRSFQSVWIGKFDGKAYKVRGNPYHNAECYSPINDHIVSIQGFKDRKIMWWGTITISKDGKTRTAILYSTDANGQQYTVKEIYDKV